MSKTNAAEIQRRAERQVVNTSGGGHLGGTKFGQANDAKTSGGSGQGEKDRPNGAVDVEWIADQSDRNDHHSPPISPVGGLFIQSLRGASSLPR